MNHNNQQVKDRKATFPPECKHQLQTAIITQSDHCISKHFFVFYISYYISEKTYILETDLFH